MRNLSDLLPDTADPHAVSSAERLRRERECEAAWARHRGECHLTSSAVNDWEAYHRQLLSEEARLYGFVEWNSPRLRERLSAEQNRRCCHCGKRMEADAPDPDDRPSFEHILPRKQGGGNRPCNLAVACRRCNVDRAHKLGWCRGKAKG